MKELTIVFCLLLLTGCILFPLPAPEIPAPELVCLEYADLDNYCKETFNGFAKKSEWVNNACCKERKGETTCYPVEAFPEEPECLERGVVE